MTVQGVAAFEATLSVPFRGAWLLDVRLSDLAMQPAAGAPVSCTFGDLRLSGSVYRGGSFTGVGQILCVGGAGGWRKTIRKRSYQSSFGLRVAQIVQDAAAECGETMAAPAPGTTPGAHWVRPEDLASKVLQLLCPDWWMGYDGRTVPTPRPSPVLSPADQEGLDVLSEETSLSQGRVVCAPALLANVLPGMVFSSPTTQSLTCVAVVHTVREERVRTELWTA